MNPPFIIHPNVIIRTPRLPFISDLNDEKIASLIHDDIFMESIYLASPVLYNECLKYINGELKDEKEINKINKSLTKYYLRTVGRCTPFGLFSGCSLGKWSDDGSNFILNKKRNRHTRFDMHYLCALAQHLSKKDFIKERLRYYTNNSLYKIGDEIRYIEYKYLFGRRIHQISSVSDTEYLERILEEGQGGITIQGIRDILFSPDIEKEEIDSFIDELLDAQILTSELEPSITGDEFQYQIGSVLKQINVKEPHEKISDIIEILEIVNNKLKKIDAADYNSAESYKEIATLLGELGVAYDESKLFQTDLINESNERRISKDVQKKLLDATELLNTFNNYYVTNPNLVSFTKRFSERYEDKQIPLLEVLDTESGIGYLERNGEDIVPLVEDIYIPAIHNPVQTYKWSPLENFLGEKIKKSLVLKERIIVIKKEELDNLILNNKWEDLPPSMHILFRIVGDKNENRIFIESCGSSSAVNLLGRFTHADKNIYELAVDIASIEEKINEDVIFAEIIHLPESRIGNVLLHKAFRKYEIPYLAKSSLDTENQIRVQDILVGVKRGNIYLTHKTTGKIIIPRLSNAHNFQQNALPVYQFLCDLQTNQLRGSLGFHWGSLKYIYKFLPRVEYKDIILSPAIWQLNKPDFEYLLSIKESSSIIELINKFKEENNLPDRVVLADGDNELFIDFGNELIAGLFIETIKNRSSIELKEFLGIGDAVKDIDNEYYNNQIVASLIKTTPTYRVAGVKSSKKTNEEVSDSFIPGSEWLYYKIYCGPKSADRILSEAIKPITEQLLNEKIIDKFFFIRYNDPDFHIRFRIRLVSTKYVGSTMNIVFQHLQPFYTTSHIWKLQTDTYKREKERYGNNTIDITESIFYYDSLSVLSMLSETWGDEREHIRWLWVMRSIDEFLNVFDYTLKEKLDLLNSMKDAFAKEFNSNKFLKEQLNVKFRKHRREIEGVLNNNTEMNSLSVELRNILENKSNQIQHLSSKLKELSAKDELEVPLSDLLFSYIHMLVNRVITSKPRLHEMVIYDFLYRYYRSEVGRSGLQMKSLDLEKEML